MEISKLKLVLRILFDKEFFSSPIGGLKETIEYAINNHNNGGTGASDALYFQVEHLNKITKSRK